MAAQNHLRHIFFPFTAYTVRKVSPAVFDSGLIGLSTLNRAFGTAYCRQFVHDRPELTESRAGSLLCRFWSHLMLLV